MEGADSDAVACQHVENTLPGRRAFFRLDIENAMPVGPRKRCDMVMGAVAEIEKALALTLDLE